MQHDNDSFRTQSLKGVFKSQRFLEGLADKFLDRFFSKRCQHTPAEAATESFDSSEADIFKSKCLLAQEMDFGIITEY